MNRSRPTTAGIDQLSLNLSVTRSPNGFGLASILLWPPGALGGSVTAVVFFCLVGCLEAVMGMAQCRGPTLTALGGLCDGGSLITVVRGMSVGGAAGLAVAVGADGTVSAGSGAVPGTAGLVPGAPLLPGPLNAVPGEARLLGGCAGAYLSLGRLMRRRPAPLCSSVNRLMAASCSSGALFGSCPMTMYRCMRKLM